jgi:hypothetical protein
MSAIYLVLLLVLILILAMLWMCSDSTMSKTGTYEGGEDISHTFLVNDIMGKLNIYIDALEKSKPSGVRNLMVYLGGLYEKPVSKFKDVADLRELLKQIVSEHNFSSANDFITKSHISYLWFLPDNKKLLLLEGQQQYSADSRDKREIESLFKEISTELGAGLSTHEIAVETEKFVKLNKIHKFRDNVCNYATTKLKKMIKSDPTKVFEVDTLGIMSRIKEYLSDWPKTKSVDVDTYALANLKRIYDYLDRLKIINYDPFYPGSRITLNDLEHRLQTAASRIATNRERETLERERLETERERTRLERERLERERLERERLERERLEREHSRPAPIVPDARQVYESQAADDREAQLQEEFYRRIQADPELENVAAAMGMSLHDLYEQYKQEKAVSGSSDDDENDDIDMSIVQKIKQDLLNRSMNQ